jgi:hypothetical protein
MPGTVENGAISNMENPSVHEVVKSRRATCILVLGAHRSGSEILAQVLKIHGCAFPSTSAEPEPDQLKSGSGTVHNQEPCTSTIQAFNNEVLGAVGTNWKDWQPLDATSRSSVIEHFGKRAGTLVHKAFADKPLSVFEDSGLGRLTPFWLDVLEQCDTDICIVLPVREPAAAAGSLHRRAGTDLWTAKLLWLRHVLDAEAATRGRKRIFTTYPELMSDWRGVLDRIGAHFDLTFPRQTTASYSEADRFMGQGSAGEIADFPTFGTAAADGDASAWMHETFEIVRRWAEYGEDAADHPLLEGIKIRFDQAARALGPAFLNVAAEREAQSAVPDTRRAGDGIDAATALTQTLRQGEALLKELEASRAETSRLASLVAEAERSRPAAVAERLERFRELAKLSEMLLEKDHALERTADLAEWLRRLSIHLINRPVWWLWLPRKRRLRLERKAMRRDKIFDPQAYLASYPDVKASGMDPVRHYLLHGIDEGRRRPE